ncbi:MAG: hypothetical protein RDU20_02915 [Desulfomonilaceae bacterium]|nr:hypothetical protein [Desulfomonilaceae bacterium]
MNSVTYFRLVAMLGAGKNSIRARRPGLRKTETKPVFFVGRASLPVIFLGKRDMLLARVRTRPYLRWNGEYLMRSFTGSAVGMSHIFVAEHRGNRPAQ